MMRHPRTLSLLFLLISVALAGCGATPAHRVANAERTYTTTANLAAIAVRQGVVKDRNTLQAMKLANDEANAALADANAKVRADVPITNDFYLDRLDSALTRWLELLAKAGVK
jgi:hypothetical protein